MNPVWTKISGQYQANVYIDPCPANPRDAENLGTIVTFSTKYRLGDTFHDFQECTKSQFVEWTVSHKNEICVLHWIYMMDHSGITITIDPQLFLALDPYGFDWGLLGGIFVTKKRVCREYSCKRISRGLKEEISRILEREVETYDQYLNNEVFGIVITPIDKLDEELVSSWGFFGLENAKKEAERMLP